MVSKRRITGSVLAPFLLASLCTCSNPNNTGAAGALHLIDVPARTAVSQLNALKKFHTATPVLLRTMANEYGAAIAEYLDTHAVKYTDIVLSTPNDLAKIYRHLSNKDVPEGFTGPLILDGDRGAVAGAPDAQSYLEQLCLGDVEGNPADLLSFAKARYNLETTLERVDSLDAARFLDKEDRTVYTAILQPGLTEYQKDEATYRIAKQHGLLDHVIVYDFLRACNIPELKKIYTTTDDLEIIAHEVVHALLETPNVRDAATRNLLEKTEEAYALALSTPLLNEYARERRSPPFPSREGVSDEVREFLPEPYAAEVLQASALRPFEYSLRTAQEHLEEISRH